METLSLLFSHQRRLANTLKEQRKYILFSVALGWNEFRTIEMIHCFLFHWRNTLQNKGDIFDFQLHTGNTLYNEVFCWQHAYKTKETKSKGNISQYCFPFPTRATHIVEEVFLLDNIYIAFCSTRETRFRNWEIYYKRVTRFSTRSSVGQHAHRTEEIKSKGEIYLNRRYCRSRLKNEVYTHMWLVCCGSIPRLIISFALNGSLVHA